MNLGYDHKDASEVSQHPLTQVRATVAFSGPAVKTRQGRRQSFCSQKRQNAALPAFFNTQTTVVRAQAVIPRHPKERAISFIAQVTVSELGALKSDEYIMPAKLNTTIPLPGHSKPQQLHFHSHHVFIFLCNLLFRKHHFFPGQLIIYFFPLKCTNKLGRRVNPGKWHGG